MDGTSAAEPEGRPGRRIAGSSKVMLAVVGAAVLALIILIAVTTISPGHAKTSQAKPAKNFALVDLDHPGQTVSLAALAGKPVIINFFASWCGPCKRETPMLAQFYRDHHGSVLVIGVDSNDAAVPALKFIKAEGVEYPVASDPFPAKVTVSYGVLALPQTFFLNAQHKIVRHIVGDLTMAELTAWATSLSSHGTG